MPNPQLCKELKMLPPTTGRMIWQQKLDGVRAIVSADRITLRTTDYANTGIDVPEGAVLDGELLATSGNFYDVMPAIMKERWNKLIYVPFDILSLRGEDLRKNLLADRLKKLYNVCPNALGIWAFPGKPMPVVPKDWEGIVGKPIAAQYREGKRTSWVKYKNIHMLDAVILGYEEGQGGWAGQVGKIVFGTRDGRRLGVASGFDAKMQRAFTLNGEQFVGKPVVIRHYGMNKERYRNPVFHGIKDF
jgi:ATP-dependent DNA ligase